MVLFPYYLKEQNKNERGNFDDAEGDMENEFQFRQLQCPITWRMFLFSHL